MKRTNVKNNILLLILISLFILIAVSSNYLQNINVENNFKTSDSNTKAELNNTNRNNTKQTDDKNKTPKYIFMFIGDGMSYPQIQLTSDYLGAIKQDDSETLNGNKYLSFMKFPVAGSAVNYNSNSYIPDSASSATSLATGHKTSSETINMDETGTIQYETIAEKLKKQKDYKIGIVTTVNLNHATPAAYYAHQDSRKNYYQISQELIKSGFDYFAGGAIIDPKGEDNNQPDIYKLVEEAGYHMINTTKEAEELTQKDGKSIVIAETLADKDSLPYSMDAMDDEWQLKDYVSKGIQVLDNENGFFMMIEGGKIDWAGHDNDAGAILSETIALNNAVNEAVEFYKKHPEETLILVTGDHETGGLSIGYASTEYETYLRNFAEQKISFEKYNSEYVTEYKKKNTSFKTVLKDIKENFGLVTKTSETDNEKLVLTKDELNQIKEAYDKTLNTKRKDRTQEDYLLYGDSEPITVTVSHILSNKSGVNFSSYSHSGLPVAVFAKGLGSELFEGYYDNTKIYENIAQLVNVK